jgi:Fe2+ or Zn2+ uptake regulation protein
MDLLKRLYYDWKTSNVAFTSAKRIHAEAKKTDPTITLAQVQRFLDEQKNL